MTQAALTKATGAEALEKVIIGGDLGTLSPEERLMYYKQTCESLGLNPLTKPFEYIKLNGKLTLYARKDCTDQLRRLNSVSIDKPEIQNIDNLIIVTVAARDKTGRTDSDIGVVTKGDMQGNAANALMKAVTKAKRRVTLSICGLGMLDETEVETIPGAQVMSEPYVDARIKVACADLNAAGDSITWTSRTLTEYAQTLFEDEHIKGSENMSDEQRVFMAEDLEERLRLLKDNQ